MNKITIFDIWLVLSLFSCLIDIYCLSVRLSSSECSFRESEQRSGRWLLLTVKIGNKNSGLAYDEKYCIFDWISDLQLCVLGPILIDLHLSIFGIRKYPLILTLSLRKSNLYVSNAQIDFRKDFKIIWANIKTFSSNIKTTIQKLNKFL